MATPTKGKKRSPNQLPPPQSLYITVRQAAWMTGMSEQWVRKEVAKGTFGKWTRGRDVRLLRSEIDAYNARTKVRP